MCGPAIHLRAWAGLRGRGGGFLPLRGSCPLFTHHCGSWRLSSPRLSKKGRVSQRRQRHPSPADAGTVSPSPTPCAPPGALQPGVGRAAGGDVHTPALCPPPGAPPGPAASGTGFMRGLRTTPSTPHPGVTDPEPLLAGGSCNTCRCDGSKATGRQVGEPHYSPSTPHPPNTHTVAPVLRRSQGGRKLSCHLHPPINIFHSVWASVKYLAVGYSGFKLLAIVGTSLVCSDSRKGRVKTGNSAPLRGRC